MCDKVFKCIHKINHSNDVKRPSTGSGTKSTSDPETEQKWLTITDLFLVEIEHL